LFRLIADTSDEDYLILAMEEPENSLHPKAQRQLLSVIQEISKQSQVIVTTHSPVFIDRSRFENNIIMTRTATGSTVAKTFDVSLLDQIRTDLGIRASDALLKGGGNCAILVEGRTEENCFPTFMEMCGMSEFRMGTAIINMNGSDLPKARSITQLLFAYDIPCVIVLDKNAQTVADDLQRFSENGGTNIKAVFCLEKGNIEDYFPLEIVAEVINTEFSPSKLIEADDFDHKKSDKERLKDFQKVMHENGAGNSIGYLKSHLGGLGAKLIKEQGLPLDPELQQIFEKVKEVAEAN
jgi:putative ATP-dependent endonuclease of the OLD family